MPKPRTIIPNSTRPETLNPSPSTLKPSAPSVPRPAEASAADGAQNSVLWAFLALDVGVRAWRLRLLLGFRLFRAQECGVQAFRVHALGWFEVCGCLGFEVTV